MTKLDDRSVAVLKKSRLFVGMEADEIKAMMDCLSARLARFEKGEYLIREGDDVDSLGVVLRGSVIAFTEDYWGNRNILSSMGASDMFAEAFACTTGVPARVNVMANEDCEVMYLNAQRIITTCSSACAFHTRLVRNLLTVLASKNVELTQKTDFITKRTIRDKVLAYLSAQSQVHGSPSFDIPYNRQQLADYLSIERSALSSVLGKLQDEGVIAFRKNHFELR